MNGINEDTHLQKSRWKKINIETKELFDEEIPKNI